jgi:hypothetical protein
MGHDQWLRDNFAVHNNAKLVIVFVKQLFMYDIIISLKKYNPRKFSNNRLINMIKMKTYDI